ncbi:MULTISPECIES: GntR family transcriptional regulator [Paenibacillus]|uniref:GntR family transcriptional regulator n=2 Tax=Paenibacillus TaxID=44249 RepID=A0ABU6D3N6_9BACL|nr:MULTISPECIES: GntR family transcriptional regulator [Paenibacillus]MBA2940527.1 GntR family transcriptional regulator [Paenibacillus sp. CGMCC 1.16610]MCY9660863.1 GntR family transcriptional regulator [Paenibacillus anseongense]MEB4792339.1 GntR family transcriptional regulator [Paenibacillus chondroitinus]MEC0265388.1 GntR family transcriptional regulator [Paenibacillus anseongense]MVQ35704.1 GntR family transcriptional regulator [Paenibacillus anseongense]
MNITFNNRDPVYLQVVRHFKEEMATGKLAAGQEIPSRRELAGLLQINPNTVQRAYKEMEEQHLITTAGNSPSRITTDKQVLNSIRQELIQEAVEVFIQSIKKIELPTDDLLRFVKEKYEAERAREVKE